MSDASRFPCSSKYIAVLAAFAMVLLAASIAHAGGTVTNCAGFGSAATPGDLAWALQGGGTVTFACSGTLVVPEISVTLADTTLDATGQAVVLSGNHTNRVFTVDQGVHLQLINLTITGGYAGWGGGLYVNNASTVTLTDSSLSGNTASNAGGGLAAYGSTITLINSTVSGNTGAAGGGILASCSTITLTASTLSGNSATAGGGLYGVGSSTVTLMNSTVSGNRSEEAGGGLRLENPGSSLTNTTVTANTATQGGGGIFFGGAAATLTRSIVAGNTAAAPAVAPDCIGGVTSAGYNLIGNTYGCGFVPTTGDAVNVDPLLGPLQDNGGPTRTHALLSGSPAIDGGGPGCPPPDVDQRGVARPHGGACDIGAFEFVSPDHVSVERAFFARQLWTLLVTATSTVGVDAQLSVTVPGCLTDAPMQWNGLAFVYAARITRCGNLVGKTATVTSSHGGVATSLIR